MATRIITYFYGIDGLIRTRQTFGWSLGTFQRKVAGSYLRCSPAFGDLLLELAAVLRLHPVGPTQFGPGEECSTTRSFDLGADCLKGPILNIT